MPKSESRGKESNFGSEELQKFGFVLPFISLSKPRIFV